MATDNWNTLQVPCLGGMITNMDVARQSLDAPGSARSLINFEAALNGGYKRVTGFGKLRDEEVPNYEDVTGTPTASTDDNPIVGLSIFGDRFLAARGDYVYYGNASTSWTRINASNPLGTPTKVRFFAFNDGGSDKIIWVSGGTDDPYQWDGSTLTQLTAAPAGAEFITEFKNHLFLAVNDVVTFSAPDNFANYTTADGAGEFKAKFAITGIKKFREELYIFGRRNISKVVGNNASDFVLVPVADNIGCIASDSIQEVGGDILFLSSDGIRPLSATVRNNDIELQSVSRSIQQDVTSFTATAVEGSICSLVVREKSQYRLLYEALGSDPDDVEGILGCLRGNGEATRWEWSKLKGIPAYCAASGYIGADEYVVHGGYDGYVYRQESGDDFAGRNVFAYFKSPDHSFGDPEVRKALYKISVYGDFGDSRDITMQMQFDFNDGNVVQPASTTLSKNVIEYRFGAVRFGVARFTAAGSPFLKDNIEGSCFTSCFIFTTNDNDPAYSISSYNVAFAALGRI